MYTLSYLVARQREREVSDQTARRGPRPSDASPVTRVVLRQAVAGDRPRLRRLAQLDGHQPPAGSALVAEVDGRLRAAVSLDGGAALADPADQGGELLVLLRMRAAQLRRTALPSVDGD